jgi:hypothetical protein
MAKEERLQLRLKDDLKRWFQEYAHRRGRPMSEIFTEYLLRLRQRTPKEDHADP